MSRSGGGDDDDGTVVPFRGQKDPGQPRKRAPRKEGGKLTDDERAAENEKRPPARQLTATRMCGARLRQPQDGTCQHEAGWGTTHPGYGRCKRHGGASKNGAKHAALQMAHDQRDKIRARAQFYGMKVTLTPEEALLEALQISAGAVRFLGDFIASWNQQATDAAELGQADPWPDGDVVDTAAQAAVDGFRLGWDKGSLADDAHDHADHAHDDDTKLYAGQRLSDPATMLPTLIAAYSTQRAVGFTDTEYAAWLKVYREERRELRACAQACIAANIQDRITRVMEERGFLHRAIIGHALQELGAAAVAPDVLRQVLQAATRKAIAELPGRAV